MNQMGLFDPQQAKERVMDQVEGNAAGFVALMRRQARQIAARYGKVTSDDLREFAFQEGIEPHHQNAWGAIFRAPEWRCVGHVRSRIKTNNGRQVRIWIRL